MANIKKGEISMKINKAEIVKEFGKNENDTGSVEVQIALLTERIKNLTEHLKSNKQDKHSTRGLNKMVSTRKKLLDYLSTQDINRARALKAKLGIRG
jgi:small subunit ribosomal protein S15